MHVAWLVILGTLAAIGALTLVAIYSVVRFGDESLNSFK